jgi:hypothetical protein
MRLPIKIVDLLVFLFVQFEIFFKDKFSSFSSPFLALKKIHTLKEGFMSFASPLAYYICGFHFFLGR